MELVEKNPLIYNPLQCDQYSRLIIRLKIVVQTDWIILECTLKDLSNDIRHAYQKD